MYCEPPKADDLEVGAEGPGRISDSELDFLILLLAFLVPPVPAAPPFPFLPVVFLAAVPSASFLEVVPAAEPEAATVLLVAAEAEEGDDAIAVAALSSMRSSSSSSSVLGLRAAALTNPWL